MNDEKADKIIELLEKILNAMGGEKPTTLGHICRCGKKLQISDIDRVYIDDKELKVEYIRCDKCGQSFEYMRYNDEILEFIKNNVLITKIYDRRR